MIDTTGQRNSLFFRACKEAILMDKALKGTTAGKHYTQRSLCKLFDPAICDLLP